MISQFWILFAAGVYQLAPEFRARDAPHVDDDEMADWLGLSEAERGAVVAAYLAPDERSTTEA